ncbi:MAG: xanthine dehydrogenase family protein subunit M [Burkholderiaceae bacterium]
MQYHCPDTIDSAVSALAAAAGKGRILAGGTDLLVQLRSGRVNPEQVIDVKKIAEMRSVSTDGDGVCVGAAVSGAELSERPDVVAQWPGVVEAFDLIGSTQIQGRATLGGNLCNASPAADSVPALIAAGAICIVAGPAGRREVLVEDIVTGPGKTSLAVGEIVVSFKLPRRSPRSGDAYLRFIPRTEMDIAVVGAGVNLTVDAQGVCTAARVGLGAVAPRPLLVDAAATALIGSSLDAGALKNAAAAASAACSPIDDKRGTVAFRTEVAGVLVRRAIVIAAQRAGVSL